MWNSDITKWKMPIIKLIISCTSVLKSHFWIASILFCTKIMKFTCKLVLIVWPWILRGLWTYELSQKKYTLIIIHKYIYIYIYIYICGETQRNIELYFEAFLTKINARARENFSNEFSTQRLRQIWWRTKQNNGRYTRLTSVVKKIPE